MKIFTTILHPIKMVISKSRVLEKVIRTKPNFSIILIKLREILFSTVSTKIDDKKPKKNKRLRDI